MLERAAQRNQATLEAHLKEFSEEGPVRRITSNMVQVKKTGLPCCHIPYLRLEVVISFPIHTWCLGVSINRGRDSVLMDTGSQVEDAVYVTLRANERANVQMQR